MIYDTDAYCARRRFTSRISRISKSVRALIAAIAAIGITLGLAACSQTQKTMNFWSGLTGDDGPAMMRIINAYNATNPEYKVIFQPMSSNDLLTKIYSVMQTGKNIPDLLIRDQFTTGVLESQGMLNPSSTWAKYEPELKESNYLPQFWEGTKVDGVSYGVPLYVYQMVIYYNKNLVQKYGLDYILDDGFVTMDEILGLEGKLPKDVYALVPSNLQYALTSMIYSAGGSIEEGVKDLTADMWRKPISKLREMNDKGLISPRDVDAEQVFGSGKGVFAVLGTWTQGNMAAALGKDNIGEANTLQVDMSNPSNFLYQQNWLQLKDPKRPESRVKAAADFIEFVREHWMMWSDVGSISPAYVDLDNPEYQKLLQASFTNSEEERQYIRTSSYLYGGYATVSGTSPATIQDIIYGDIGVDEGLKQLDQITQGLIQIQDEA